MKRLLRDLWCLLTGKEPEAVVVILHSGDPARSAEMAAIMRSLIPERRTIELRPLPGESAGDAWLRLRRTIEGHRTALAAVLFDDDPQGAAFRRAAFTAFPRKILAFNNALERHHLRLIQPVASCLFLRGVPVDRIFLRPSWLAPWTKDRSVIAQRWTHRGGRGFRHLRPRVAILSPYCPWPAAHGGAVRLANLLPRLTREFDIAFFGFEDGQTAEDLDRLDATFACVFTAPKPRYREPRWSSLLPPEAREFHSPGLHAELLARLQEFSIPVLQTEYTMLATYGGDVLTEHDVTWDLFQQVHNREHSLQSWWDLFRWRRFEQRAVRRARRVAVMSEKDAGLLSTDHAVVIPNGVDLRRFTVVPEPEGMNLLFVGSFRHFPNVQAWRFFLEEVWPQLRQRLPHARVTVVAGPDPHLHWTAGEHDPRIEMHGYVADVQPLYAASNIVLVPTLVSAGTNLKALEAMASGRAMVSTPAGVAGLGLRDGESVALADSAAAFAAAIAGLAESPARRSSMARSARDVAVREFGWDAVAARQASVWRNLQPTHTRIDIRRMIASDLPAVARIQTANLTAAQWVVADYLAADSWILEADGRVAAFLATRLTAPDETEVLNVAVDPEFHRRGFASRLLSTALEGSAGRVFLEVRASNTAALLLYQSLGFQQVGRREKYYQNPPEAGIVMSLQKC